MRKHSVKVVRRDDLAAQSLMRDDAVEKALNQLSTDDKNVPSNDKHMYDVTSGLAMLPKVSGVHYHATVHSNITCLARLSVRPSVC